jgi:hypothetical protein
MAKKKSSKGSLLRADSFIQKAMTELKKVIESAELPPKRLRALRSKRSKLLDARVGIVSSRYWGVAGGSRKTSRKKGSRKAARKTSRKAARRTSRKKSSRRRTSRR